MLTPQAVRSACVQLAAERAAALVLRRMKRGLNSLTGIASTAPWFGFFGAMLGIYSSFSGIPGEKTAGMAALAEHISEGLAPAAIGILVALQAVWTYLYLNSQVEALNLEMQTAARGLTALATQP